jgi:SNF2 family DNA or RNA helicase
VRIAPIPDELNKTGKFPPSLLKHFGADGEFIGSITEILPQLLENLNFIEPEKRKEIFIHEDVHNYIDNLKHQESVNRQKKWFHEQIEAGNRSLDVLNSALYKFQKDGVLHLAFGGRALLADDMGLGKTVQAIAAVSLLKELRDIQRVLIVCPSSLKHQWEREIQRFTSFSTN